MGKHWSSPGSMSMEMVLNQSENEIVPKRFWEDTLKNLPKLRLPSKYLVSTRNIQRLLKKNVQPGSDFLEIGCAPGKILAWVASKLQARIAGLDYSEWGIEFTRELLKALSLKSDIRCEDIFHHTFPEASFDCVFSNGLIEHFRDPRALVEIHVRLTKPGGRVIITIPNYSGLYGWLQHRFAPENLALHNLSLMSPQALLSTVPKDLVNEARAYPLGRFSPFLICFHQRWPDPLVTVFAHALNGIGYLQPVDIRPLCPLLVLEIHNRRKRA